MKRLAVLLSLCLFASAAAAQDKVRAKVFPGSQNLPHYVGIAKGIFLKHGVAVELLFTANSDELRNELGEGKIDVAHAAVDNALAMVEVAKKDVAIVMGGDSSMNELFVQGNINSLAELKGKVVIVDAPNTAYALQAKKILRNAGLKDGDYQVKPIGGTLLRAKAMTENKDYAASILNPPFSFAARRDGMKSMGRAIDLLGPYQATGAWVMRPWAAANARLLERYLAGYIESTRWARDLKNRDECIRLLSERLKLDPAVAAQTYAALMDPAFGLAPDSQFNTDGFKNVLALRAEIEGQWGGHPPPPDKYLELGYYERALKLVK
jgi:ABC-type nitrate/sulfonate/bicarbonate transport system substrate-binding protein